jgi:hypothetical protein
MRGRGLESVSTEDLVHELKRRFESLERARSLLLKADFHGASIKPEPADGRKRRGRKTMSAAARQRISDAQKARWAKQKSGKKAKQAAATPAA